MIPQRFVTEYPHRCGQLLQEMEEGARHRDLLGSFALLVASAAFTIPFGRMTEEKHPIGKPERHLFQAIEGLEKRPFLDAPFLDRTKHMFFRYAEISTKQPEHAASWRNAAGVHPIKSSEVADGKTVLKAVRNALAHGNIIYLDESGEEKPGKRLHYIAFLSERRHRNCIVGYRVVIFDEESFLGLLKSWIAWLQTFPPETTLSFSEAAD